MITEDYVSLEVAKLLKENGFDEVTAFVYSDKGELLRLSEFGTRDLTNKDCDGYSKWQFPIEDVSSIISAPTIQMAMKWLMETFQLMPLPYALSLGWAFDIFDLSNRDITGCKKIYSMDIPSKSDIYKSYEEVCDASIKHCLENLI